MATEAQLRAIRKYDDANTKQYHLKLNNKTDREIIDWLSQQDSVQGYIKRLIREDMEHRKDGKSPLKERKIKKYPWFEDLDNVIVCPVCKERIDNLSNDDEPFNADCCPYCGIHLDWSRIVSYGMRETHE